MAQLICRIHDRARQCDVELDARKCEAAHLSWARRIGEADDLDAAGPVGDVCHRAVVRDGDSVRGAGGVERDGRGPEIRQLQDVDACGALGEDGPSAGRVDRDVEKSRDRSREDRRGDLPLKLRARGVRGVEDPCVREAVAEFPGDDGARTVGADGDVLTRERDVGHGLDGGVVSGRAGVVTEPGSLTIERLPALSMATTV